MLAPNAPKWFKTSKKQIQTAKQKKGERRLHESCSAAAIAALSASSMALCWLSFKYVQIKRNADWANAVDSPWHDRQVDQMVCHDHSHKMSQVSFTACAVIFYPQKTAFETPPFHWTQSRIFQGNVVPERMLQNNCVSHMQGILRSQSTSSYFKW